MDYFQRLFKALIKPNIINIKEYNKSIEYILSKGAFRIELITTNHIEYFKQHNDDESISIGIEYVEEFSCRVNWLITQYNIEKIEVIKEQIYKRIINIFTRINQFILNKPNDKLDDILKELVTGEIRSYLDEVCHSLNYNKFMLKFIKKFSKHPFVIKENNILMYGSIKCNASSILKELSNF